MSRQRINLNREWRFVRDDVASAEVSDFDDSDWQRIGLPHCFDLPYFRTPEFYVGHGWYRRRFPVHQRSPRRFFLEFDGVFQVAEIFVNGIRVGEHAGGYTGFSIDITAAVREGENVLAVRVNNLWNPRLAPRAGEHIFSGGIYRDVCLQVTDEIHVPWCGARVTTPFVSRDAATVTAITEVRNMRPSAAVCSLVSKVIDPLGHSTVVQMNATATIQPGQAHAFEQSSNPIANPKLWHPDHPHLYIMRTEVFVEGDCVDSIETIFGFRWFDWTADHGFRLNGEHLYLRGANAHQDHAGWGIGVTQAACRRDVKLIKDAGFNFVRGAHYPHHPAFAHACDTLGVLFWSEATFWGKGGFGPEGYWNASAYPTHLEDGPAFEQSCLHQLEEMIRISRNHPCIIAWSMCNEPFFTYHLDHAKGLLRKMVARSRELDPTRPAAIGGAQRGDIDRIGDIAGYNGDGARLFIDPGIPSLVSEYGAISKPPNAFEPFWGEKQTQACPWRAGEAIWCGFDYGSIAGKQGLKGIVDHQRLPKRSWDWHREHNLKLAPAAPPRDAPAHAISLHADKTVIDGTDALDDSQIVVTLVDAEGRRVSSSPPVSLTIESGPGEFPTGRSITFDAGTDNAISLGRAATALRSYHAGESVIRAASRGLADVTLRITTIGHPPWVEGVTRPCSPRPYTSPPTSDAARRAMASAVNIALNRPCAATSEQHSHPARLANDGQAQTVWRAAEPLASWILDLEGFYQLASLRLVFAQAANFRFLVELSDDRSCWQTAIDRTQTDNDRAIRNDVFSPGDQARYVRIRFTHVPDGQTAHLAEVEIMGILAVR